MQLVTNSGWCHHRELWWGLHHTTSTNCPHPCFVFLAPSFFIRNILSSLEDVTLITSQPMSRLTQSSGWRCLLPVSTLPSRCFWRRSGCQWLPPPEDGWGQHSGGVGIWKKHTCKYTRFYYYHHPWDLSLTTFINSHPYCTTMSNTMSHTQ